MIKFLDCCDFEGAQIHTVINLRYCIYITSSHISQKKIFFNIMFDIAMDERSLVNIGYGLVTLESISMSSSL